MNSKKQDWHFVMSAKTNFFMYLLSDFHHTFSAMIVNAFLFGQIVDNAVGGSFAGIFQVGVNAFHTRGGYVGTGNNGIGFVGIQCGTVAEGNSHF